MVHSSLHGHASRVQAEVLGDTLPSTGFPTPNAAQFSLHTFQPSASLSQIPPLEFRLR